MLCPACSKKIDIKSIRNKKSINFVLQFCCPNCEKWISFQPRWEYLKILGFFVLLVGSLANFVVADVDVRIVFSAAAFFGALLALIATKKNKLQIVNYSNSVNSS